MSAALAAAPPAANAVFIEPSTQFRCMGGRVTLRVAASAGTEAWVEADLRRVAARIRAWAGRITRFDDASELSRLNRQAHRAASTVGPSLGDLLERAGQLSAATGGLLDISLLEARVGVEHGTRIEARAGRWRLEHLARRHIVHRRGRVSFDLDGVGKGWIADRALGLLDHYPAAMVDADGDVAVRPWQGARWGIAIADPRGSSNLVVVSPSGTWTERFGIATSGTTVHGWELESGWAHHLIDPRTGSSADTDVEQATVVAKDALTAESFAKAVVIAGSEAGLRLLREAGLDVAFILLRSGQLIAPPSAEAWLA